MKLRRISAANNRDTFDGLRVCRYRRRDWRRFATFRVVHDRRPTQRRVAAAARTAACSLQKRR